MKFKYNLHFLKTILMQQIIRNTYASLFQKLPKAFAKHHNYLSDALKKKKKLY